MVINNTFSNDNLNRWEQLRVVIDSEVGIIKQLLPGILAPGDPPIFSYAGVMANTKAYGSQQCNQRNGGAGFSDIQAKVSAVGECLERYCAAFYEPNKLVFASWKDLGKEAVHPSEWCLFNQKQYKLFKSLGYNYEPFTETTKVRWIKGWSLTKEQPKFVPSQMVYIPYRRIEKEAIISPSISTGMAFGCSWTEALCYGLYEHFERDAFSLWWLWRLSVPNIDINNSDIKRLCKLFSPIISKIWIKYLTLDFKIHVIGVFGLGKIKTTSGERKTTIIMGSSARLNPINALYKTFLEMGQAAPFYRHLLDRNPAKKFEDDLKNLWDFDDHPYYWLMNTDKIISKLKFLNNGVQIRMESLSNLDKGNNLDNVNYMLGLLKEKNLEAIAVDLTTPDVESIGGKVCKVLIPSFQPLEGAHLLRHLGGERLLNVPVQLGFFPETPGFSCLNPLPHPSA